MDRDDLAEGRSLRCGAFRLDLSRPLVMGIVNLTPDSFSDGGRFERIDVAVARAAQLIDEGADVIDVGAESTRPGASSITVDDEAARLMPFLAAMRGTAIPISVDTRKPAVMRRAIDAGASMINDIEGFTSAHARSAVADADCALCAMHMQGDPETMQHAPHYDDVVTQVTSFLRRQADALFEAGVAHDRVVLDPGFGFGKSFDHNVALLRGLDAIVGLGFPVLVGLSRKGMIGTITGKPVDERVAGSVAAAMVAVERGASIVRVHDVAATVDALRVWAAVRRDAR